MSVYSPAFKNLVSLTSKSLVLTSLKILPLIWSYLEKQPLLPYFSNCSFTKKTPSSSQERTVTWSNICERCSGLRAPRLNSPLCSVVVRASPCLECMCSTSILWPTTRPLSSRLGYQPPRLGALVVWLPFDEHCLVCCKVGFGWKVYFHYSANLIAEILCSRLPSANWRKIAFTAGSLCLPADHTMTNAILPSSDKPLLSAGLLEIYLEGSLSFFYFNM